MAATARLPDHLYRIYVQYKADTNMVVGWLLSHGSSSGSISHDLSIREIKDLGENVVGKGVQMPEGIAWLFRACIAARTRITKHYSGMEGSAFRAITESHEYFTNV